MEIIGTQQGLTQREKALLLKQRLGYFLRNPERTYRMNSRETSDTGLAYTDAAVDAGEVFCALGQCTPRQQLILELWLGGRPLAHAADSGAGEQDSAKPRRRLTQTEVAKVVGVSLATVNREAAAALRRMIVMIWED